MEPLSEDAEFFFSNVALTNVDKVARPKNNIDPALRKIPDGYYTPAEEIEVLKPCLVWFPAGLSYDRHLEKALPDASVRALDGEVAEVEGLECLALRIYHPQYTKGFNTRRFACYLRCAYKS